MKSSVIVFPGSNCDRDIAVALEKMQFQNQMVWHFGNSSSVRTVTSFRWCTQLTKATKFCVGTILPSMCIGKIPRIIQLYHKMLIH